MPKPKRARPQPAGPTALTAGAVRWRCDPDDLSFDSTEDLEPLVGVIGQDDAIESLRFGLATGAPGQNIFVRGLTGTGRMTLLKRLMLEIRPRCPLASDRCFVHHFAQQDRPRLVSLPRGRGMVFKRQVDRVADTIRDQLGSALSSDRIKERRAALDRAAEHELQKATAPFNDALRAANLALVPVQLGPVVQTTILPLWQGKPVSAEEFERLRAEGKIDEEAYKATREKLAEFSQQVGELTEGVNELRRRHEQGVHELLEREARSIVERLVDPIRQEFPSPQVAAFLTELVDDVVKNRLAQLGEDTDFVDLYRVNVVLSHADDVECPIVLENAPTVQNLLGNVDYEFDAEGQPWSSHMGIRAGSILRADGGYLVLDARDVLTETGAWRVLVRTLRTGRLEITPPERGQFWPGPTVKPEPIDVHVKVVLLGDADVYYLLDAYDPDFTQLFKVLADFDATIPREPDGATQYGRVLARIAKDEQLPALDRTAVAALVEHGARIASRKGKLTARFGRLADIAREAAFVAGLESAGRVSAAHVHEAIRRGRRRADLPARRYREFVADGTIRVQTEGAVVGQVNGLAVLNAGPLTYGFPARITSTIGPGSAGVINIEREADLSGAIHTKGFYILGGLLRWLLRTDHPLAFDASIAFEQSYGGIDGDSASAAEICCLLSALTDVPLRQDLAITGAIDQVGHVLPVGAVNEKIEGFFDVCQDMGLTGTQGVVIPQANAGDLMLAEDVVESCRAGRFRVYAVDTVQDALTLLAHTPAGTRGSDGRYPEGTLLSRACQRANEYWRRAVEGAPDPPPPRKRTAKD